MALQRVRSNMLANNFVLDDDQGLTVGSGNNIYIDTINNQVGINTNTTTHALTVNGDISATNFYGDGSQLTGLSSTLDEVTTNGDTTTNSITVGGLIVNSSGALGLPVGTTGERPTATDGLIRFNSDLVAFEGYDGNEWGALGGGGATYSTTAPTTNLKEGDLWFDTGTTGELYVYSGTEWLSVTGAGGSAFYQRGFLGDSSTTAFNVYGTGTSTVVVYINGVFVTTPADYSYANGVVTFVTPPALNDEINVLVYGETTGISLSLDSLSDVDLTTTAPTDGQVLVYDISGNKFIPGDSAADFTDLTGSLALSQIPDALITPAKLQSSITISDEFTASGSTADFTLSRDPGSAAAIQVFVDSVPQLVSNYTVNGTTLTLAAAPANGSIVEVRGYGVASSVGTPTDLSVTTNKIANGAVTAVKLDAAITTDNITEGSTNLYYTDARVASYLSANDFDTATNIVASITDSAPATLDTLNELAAALGDDPNFATTVTNSIADKLPLAGGTLTGDLLFGDNNKAIFGAGSDLQIYHDGTNSYINEAGVGGIRILSNELVVEAESKITAAYARLNIDGTSTAQYSGGSLWLSNSSTANNFGVQITSQVANADTTGSQYVINEVDSAGNFSKSIAGYDHSTSTFSHNQYNYFNAGLGVTGDITASGNVGIGPTNPLAKLHVDRSTSDNAQRTIYADGNHDPITTNGTNYLHNVWIENHNFDIDSGVVDSGYRIGLNIEGYHDSNVFEGTLATQKNIWSRNGNNSGGTGTITNLYNLHLETLSGGGMTITNNYGLYQSGVGTKNYFEGNIGIGTNSPNRELEIKNDNPGQNTGIKIHNNSTSHAAIIELEAGRTTDGQDVSQILTANNGNNLTNIRTHRQGPDGGDLRFLTSASGSGDVLTERMRISETGHISMPDQPGFYAYGIPTISNGYIINFQSVNYNEGNYYNNSTGTFTTPIAGYYFISIGILFSTEGQIYVNDGSGDFIGANARGGGGTGAADGASATASGIFYIPANRSIRIQAPTGAIAASTPRNFFTMRLAG